MKLIITIKILNLKLWYERMDDDISFKIFQTFEFCSQTTQSLLTDNVDIFLEP